MTEIDPKTRAIFEAHMKQRQMIDQGLRDGSVAPVFETLEQRLRRSQSTIGAMFRGIEQEVGASEALAVISELVARWQAEA